MIELNSQIDHAALAERFKADGRVQIRDVLTLESAQRVRALLLSGTKWGLVWQAGEADGVESLTNRALISKDAQAIVSRAGAATDAAGARGDYSFRFANYPVLQACLEGWDPGGPHDSLIEAMNMPAMLDMVRAVTSIPGLTKADAQATLFAPNHFLGLHTDAHRGQGWRVAYVLNFAPDDWSPDWGGYLQFFDEDGNIICGWRPRFNVLNLMAVPCAHSVSYVPPFAPNGRAAITGWFRDL